MSEMHKELLSFIKNSPSVFHGIHNICSTLKESGFVQLKEEEKWDLKSCKNNGGKYFVVRNNSSVIAFAIPQDDFDSFAIVSSHSDSPTFKIKENPEIKTEAGVKLNVEKYGGMILSPWFDRPLSIAGRVIYENEKGKLEEKLVNLNEDLVMIPNLAIHLNRDINRGGEISVQNEMCPVLSLNKDASLSKMVAEQTGLSEEKILSSDLFLYSRSEPSIWGAEKEFISSGRIDDLECAWTSLQSFVKACNKMEALSKVKVYAVFDNEEVGSLTRQGADSTFFSDVLNRINNSFGRSNEELMTALAKSFMLSADNAHGLHPNYSGKYDPVNRPLINKGPVLKFNAAQKYTTDGISSALFKQVCKKAEVPFQIYTNNSDIAGGSTLGNISNAHISIRCADIGLAQWAMHSPYETAGVKDVDYMIKALEAFYRQDF